MGGGGHSSTELVSTAKIATPSISGEHPILGAAQGLQKRDCQLKTKNIVGAVTYKLFLFSFYILSIA